MRLDLANSGYGFTMTVTNTGEQWISQVQVPFTAQYTDGTSESRTAILAAIDVDPGEVYQHYTLINPPSQIPYYNPRYVLTDKSVNTVNYGDPELTCRGFPLQ